VLGWWCVWDPAVVATANLKKELKKEVKMKMTTMESGMGNGGLGTR
jgi:hypothetical protein